MKKVLIFSVTAGNGHISAAQAIGKELEERGATVRIVDILEDNPYYFRLADKGYLFSVKRLLGLYNAVFRHFQRANPASRYHSSITNTVIACARRNYRIIRDFEPDVIYGPHFYVGALITYLKKSGYPIPAKTVINALDYCFSPYWETGVGADRFIVADRAFFPKAQSLGYREDQLADWGIPLKASFYREYDRRAERIRLGLDPDKPTFIVMFGGGFSSGGTKIYRKLVAALKGRQAQIIKINGHDQKGFRATQKSLRRLPEGLTTLNIPFTREMERYIAASDLAVTKCGGLSSTELSTLGVPFLVLVPLPEQEKQNLAHWQKQGAAIAFHTKAKLCKEVRLLLDDPDRMERMRKQAQAKTKNATSQIVDWILSCPDANYSSLPEPDYSSVEKRMRRALRIAHKNSMREYRQKKKTEKARLQK